MTEPSVVFFIRHGTRQDQQDQSWAATAPAPYDPPLAASGVTQSQKAGAQIWDQIRGLDVGAELHDVYIHTSPFRRCVESARSIALGMVAASGDAVASHSPYICIDSFLGEWLNPEYFEDIKRPPPTPSLSRSAMSHLRMFRANRGTQRLQELRSGVSAEKADSARRYQLVEDYDSELFGTGGEFGEGLNAMENRIVAGYEALLRYREGQHKTSRPSILVLVLHAAGCRALTAYFTNRTVLHETPVSALSMAVRHADASAPWTLMLNASEMHLLRSEAQSPPVSPAMAAPVGADGLWRSRSGSVSSLNSLK